MTTAIPFGCTGLLRAGSSSEVEPEAHNAESKAQTADPRDVGA